MFSLAELLHTQQEGRDLGTCTSYLHLALLISLVRRISDTAAKSQRWTNQCFIFCCHGLHDELCSDLNLLQNNAHCCCTRHSVAITAHQAEELISRGNAQSFNQAVEKSEQRKIHCCIYLQSICTLTCNNSLNFHPENLFIIYKGHHCTVCSLYLSCTSVHFFLCFTLNLPELCWEHWRLKITSFQVSLTVKSYFKLG